jgi:hypothetical protein
MFSQIQLPLLLCLLVLPLPGCSDTAATKPTPKDEISAYLDEHPELKEKKTYQDHSNPLKP